MLRQYIWQLKNYVYACTFLASCEDIICYRPNATITTDQGTMFTSGEFDEFAISMGIKVFNSSPYYAQANGQAKASNKGIIKLIKRMIEENPTRWHTLLSEALWS